MNEGPNRILLCRVQGQQRCDGPGNVEQNRATSKKDVNVLGPEVGPSPAVFSGIPTEMRGLWANLHLLANLTPSSLAAGLLGSGVRGAHTALAETGERGPRLARARWRHHRRVHGRF